MATRCVARKKKEDIGLTLVKSSSKKPVFIATNRYSGQDVSCVSVEICILSPAVRIYY